MGNDRLGPSRVGSRVKTRRDSRSIKTRPRPDHATKRHPPLNQVYALGSGTTAGHGHSLGDCMWQGWGSAGQYKREDDISRRHDEATLGKMPAGDSLSQGDKGRKGQAWVPHTSAIPNCMQAGCTGVNLQWEIQTATRDRRFSGPADELRILDMQDKKQLDRGLITPRGCLKKKRSLRNSQTGTGPEHFASPLLTFGQTSPLTSPRRTMPFISTRLHQSKLYPSSSLPLDALTDPYLHALHLGPETSAYSVYSPNFVDSDKAESRGSCCRYQ